MGITLCMCHVPNPRCGRTWQRPAERSEHTCVAGHHVGTRSLGGNAASARAFTMAGAIHHTRRAQHHAHSMLLRSAPRSAGTQEPSNCVGAFYHNVVIGPYLGAQCKVCYSPHNPVSLSHQAIVGIPALPAAVSSNETVANGRWTTGLHCGSV